MRSAERFSTNKAEFLRSGSLLRKTYFGSGDAARDETLLREMDCAMGVRSANGWSYRVVRVHDSECFNELVMDFVNCQVPYDYVLYVERAWGVSPASLSGPGWAPGVRALSAGCGDYRGTRSA